MSKRRFNKSFVDSIKILVEGGKGGRGNPQNRGTGGKGGDVYVEGTKLKDLSFVKFNKPRNEDGKKRWAAGRGNDSNAVRFNGEPGKDLVIPVPRGTRVSTKSGYLLGDILREDDCILLASGGTGGNSENNYSGQRGEMCNVELLLKIIADIGLVGFPNAGKSTLLTAISHSQPKIASYPFTTLEPIVGILKYDDFREISMADLPGLIEGAWINRGMGHQFLQHVERTKLLLFVVDIEGFRLAPEYPHRSAIETIILLNKELELYQPELIDKPALLVLNKMDKVESDKPLQILKEQLANIKDVAETMSEEMQPEKFVSFGKILGCSAKYDKKSVLNLKENLRLFVDLYNSNNERTSVEYS